MYALIRRLHMYTGLLTFSNLVIFGIAGLHATFEPAPAARKPPVGSVRTQAFEPPANATDKQVAIAVYQALRPPLSWPVPDSGLRRNATGELTFDFYSPNGVQRVVVLEKSRELRVEEVHNGLFQFLNNAHAMTSGSRSPHTRVRLWAYYNEFAMWALLGMVLSGIYLWLASRPGFGWAQLSFVAGAGAFAALYWLTR